MKNDIKCPLCDSKVSEYHKGKTMDIEVMCRKCRVLVVYDIKYHKTKVKEVPKRNTITGRRFY